MGRRRLPGLTLACLVLAATIGWTAKAMAATVRTENREITTRSEPTAGQTLTGVIYAGASRERNRLRVSVTGGEVVLRDRVRVRAGPGCRQRGRRAAVCPVVEGIANLTVSLGGARDRASIDGALPGTDDGGGVVRVDAGAGDDSVDLGRNFARILAGGPGDDVLRTDGAARFRGGPGNDRMTGGGGADHFDESGFGGGRDTIRGRGGTDRVTYARRARGVSVTLDGRRDDGVKGERDLVAGDVESVIGGTVGDLLVGNARRNTLVGAGGADRIEGGAGSDALIGSTEPDTRGVQFDGGDRIGGGEGADAIVSGRGADRLEGGPGEDRIQAGPGDDRIDGGADIDSVSGQEGSDVVGLRDRSGDVVLCGAGDDRIALDELDFFSGIGGRCETVDREGPALASFVGTSVERTRSLGIGCPLDAAGPCAARVRFDGDDGSIGEETRYGADPGTVDTILLPLGPEAQERCNRFERISGTLVVAAREPGTQLVERRYPLVICAG